MIPWWAKTQLLARAVTALSPVQEPPVVVLGLPRSGSSWLARLLSASHVLYLREPLTTAYQATGGSGAAFAVDGDRLPAAYRTAARRAFAGIPTAGPPVLAEPGQWRLRRRAGRRVLVKEVNPYMAQWLLETQRAAILVLVRHPAAVAVSMRSQGWEPRDGSWRAHGDYQGAALAAAKTALDAAGSGLVIRYEDLCMGTATVLEEAVRFAGLDWGPGIESEIRITTAGNAADESPYGTVRKSSSMPDRWRSSIRPDELSELWAGYEPHGLPWYEP